MERKRKLPARAAARGENAAKKRNITPREDSATPAPPPAPAPAPEPEPEEPPPPPLPKSIQAGKPLPTVEVAQPEDLSSKEYQTVGESGVLAESLSRSRQKWISEGLFAKYWTKPHKRKGVLNEDPKNPPKETMSKVGTVTITVEPHIIEATMYVVKDPKPKVQPIPQQQPQHRPIIQYGPPNGTMPPPLAPPASTAGTPVQNKPATTKSIPPSPSQGPVRSPAQQPQPLPRASQDQSAGLTTAVKPGTAPPANSVTPSPSPSFQQRPQAAGGPVAPSPTPPVANTPSNIAAPSPAMVTAAPTGPMAAPAMSPVQRPPSNPQPTTTGLAKPAPAPVPGSAASGPAPAAKPSANDPVIALLAQKASGDAELRDLMKRVAVGQAKEGELAHFQKIIDQLNAEYRSRGGQQGPSADRLLVDGRTVQYFATEVRTILDIVLASNPNQKSSELRPPQGSDPLVVLLVKTALEDQRTRDMIRRIAESRPGFTDATDLKEILDRLHRDMKTAPRASPAPVQIRQQTPNGMPNGQLKAPQTGLPPNPQALRSKGPPPAPKPDVTAVVFDFGTGDRYLFPKFSILEYLPTASGQQVVASFLIVRKGSTSEYGGDPKLDYYQPVTIRLFTQTGRHLENLARVVAPQEEVRRYMDDVMDNMTRAEYVLLAMRLPKTSPDVDKDGTASEEPRTNVSTPKPDVAEPKPAPKVGVLWTTKGNSETPPIEGRMSKPARDAEQEAEAKYQRLINQVSAKDTEA
ncbi:hypothetical protein ACHAPA_002442 [Fusarium lateritium]